MTRIINIGQTISVGRRRKSGEVFSRLEGGGRRAESDEKGKFLLPFRNTQEQEVGRSDGGQTEVFTLL